jgi:hypothetical protein
MNDAALAAIAKATGIDARLLSRGALHGLRPLGFFRFALFLFLLLVVTGAVWALEAAWLRKRRAPGAKVLEVLAQGPRTIAEMVDDFGPAFDAEGNPLEAGESERVRTEAERETEAAEEVPA